MIILVKFFGGDVDKGLVTKLYASAIRTPKILVIHAYRWWANLKARFEKCGLRVTQSARFRGLLPICPHADGPREAKLFSREDGASE